MSALAGELVTGHLIISSSEAVDVTVRLSVRQDRIVLTDREVESNTFQISLSPGQSRELEIDFVVEGGLTVRGYFLKIDWPGGNWEQQGYPPRLSVE